MKRIYGVFEVHGQEFNYDTRSLYIFDQSSKFRWLVVWIAEWKWFKYFITFSIILNSIIMTMENYEKRINQSYQETDLDKFVKIAGMVFTWLFTVEFALKVIAMGFVIHKKSYLRDWWNRLDFLIVSIGMLEIMIGDETG